MIGRVVKWKTAGGGEGGRGRLLRPGMDSQRVVIYTESGILAHRWGKRISQIYLTFLSGLPPLFSSFLSFLTGPQVILACLYM